MNLSYSLPQPEKSREQFRPDPPLSEGLYFCSAGANLGINYNSQSHSEENSHEDVIPVCGPSAGGNAFSGGPRHAQVTGKWSGTLQMDGQNDAKPAYSIFHQDGNKLSGSVGPDESEQDSLEGGKVDGDKLTFDVPQGPNGEGSIHVEMQVKGDQMTGRATWSGPPPHSGSGKISLKRVVEK